MINAICDSVMSTHERGIVLCDGLGWLRCFVLKLRKRALEARGLSDASATRFTFINPSEISCSLVKGDIVRVKNKQLFYFNFETSRAMMSSAHKVDGSSSSWKKKPFEYNFLR
jgi:hypothetical protein